MKLENDNGDDTTEMKLLFFEDDAREMKMELPHFFEDDAREMKLLFCFSL
jgi:hypothetical protein